MRITILALGTRGDVQPYVALGLGLQRAGHEVRLVAFGQFRTLVESTGLEFYSAGADTRELAEADEEASAVIATIIQGGTIRQQWEAYRRFRPIMERMQESFWQASQGTQAIIFSTIGMIGYHVAEKLTVPCVWALTTPVLGRTRIQPNPLLPSLPLGGGYNLLSHAVAEQSVQQVLGRLFNSWREERLELPGIPLHKWPYTRLHGRAVPLLYGYSPAVVPRPPDWNKSAHVTGYWFLDHAPDWQPPAGLVDFLESGPPPIYIGFGSLVSGGAEEATRVVLKALRQSGQRGVIATGWGGLRSSDLPDGVFALESVPHDWLFPRTAAVVHHGGAGTTGAGLRAGVPSIVVPGRKDQPFWARRVEALGAGPAPIPRKRLTEGRLAEAIRAAALDESIRRRAAVLGETIRREDGVESAVRVVNQAIGAGG